MGGPHLTMEPRKGERDRLGEEAKGKKRKREEQCRERARVT